MDRTQFIVEFVVVMLCAGLLMWGFASGSEHSWGWKAIVELGQWMENK